MAMRPPGRDHFGSMSAVTGELHHGSKADHRGIGPTIARADRTRWSGQGS